MATGSCAGTIGQRVSPLFKLFSCNPVSLLWLIGDMKTPRISLSQNSSSACSTWQDPVGGTSLMSLHLMTIQPSTVSD